MKKLPTIFLIVLFFLTFIKSSPFVHAAEIKTSGELMSLKVSPGELLPVSVKLLNFGNNEKVDVTITYQIFNKANEKVVTETETVAVQTTATFIKNIQVPYNLPSGRYYVESTIIYDGQKVPATSKFEFAIEQKIFGIFVNQFILYAIITISIGIIFAVISRLLITKKASRVILHDYSEIPKPQRMYFEMINDMLVQMHNSVGDSAYEMANTIKGLYIDKDTGKIKTITTDPAEIITLLIIKYQAQFGKNEKILNVIKKGNSRPDYKPIEDNINLISKYFNSNDNLKGGESSL